MPRLIESCPAKPENLKSAGARETYTVELVTPLFGGGVEAGEVDPANPVRIPEIRGQLRFWWRATRGVEFDSAEKLRAREAEIWGDSESPSKVIVGLVLKSVGEAKRCAEYKWNPARGMWKTMPEWEPSLRELTYALFPFQGKPPQRQDQGCKPQKAPSQFIARLSFDLNLRFPESLRQDVEAAMQAWLNFGGIGARTRRGCGALFCSKFSPPDQGPKTVAEWLAKKLILEQRFPGQKWPTLTKRVFVGKVTDPMDAWLQGIRLLRDFRQGIDIGRNPGEGPRPGRSRWPEPEAIRNLTRKRAAKYGDLHMKPAFPRADFGLPIIFHFQQGGKGGDPSDTCLQPSKTVERMSSPLIIKPLALSQRSALPLIVWLQVPELESVELVEKEGEGSWNSTAIRVPWLSESKNSPIAGVRSGSALDGFIKFVCDRGFDEVLP